ncbi:phosphatase PAP2 family protein [Gorillibacterium sp. sgz5001074]|uniref:phosphatase PAP2 family protein n=1 Tax=Gorillibacterium sp. sgz5001074 TaxID=3446695 RepID=UPI003F67DB8A
MSQRTQSGSIGSSWLGRLTVWAAGCGAVFLLLLAGLAGGWWNQADQRAAEAFRDMQNEGLTPLFKVLSELGSTLAFVLLFVAATVLLLWQKKQREALILLISTGGAYALNSLLKEAIQRERPALPHLIEADGFSFPSGNAMVATAFYGMLAIFILCSGLPRRRLFAGLIAVVLLLIGFSRLYLNVHYPTDILAGYAAGGCWLLGCSLFYIRR